MSAKDEKQIWDFLKSKGLNDYATAGIMGNLYAESGLQANNLQNTYEKKFGMTDMQYTESVDNGKYTNFIKDSAGYGLAQWTYWSRKQALLEFCKVAKTSIGDLTMQLNFLWKELQGYKSVINVLNSAKSIKEASDVVLLQYERPADQSDAVKVRRTNYGQGYFNKYAKSIEEVNKMSNSPLVNHIRISPNSSNPRNKPITKITIHHVAGNASVEALGNLFAAASRRGSSNYGIGTDGRIGMYVEEKNRAWTSGSAENDNQAITIEVANDNGAPNWHVSDKALARLIDLCADICRRNNIKKLNFTGNKNGNLTMHKWFQATACPGPYLESKFPYIAAEVNKRLQPVATPQPGVLYRVQTGAFSNKAFADALLVKVKAKGFDTYMIQENGLYKVQVGAYSNKANANAQAAKLRAAGFDTYITTKSGTAVT